MFVVIGIAVILLDLLLIGLGYISLSKEGFIWQFVQTVFTDFRVILLLLGLIPFALWSIGFGIKGVWTGRTD